MIQIALAALGWILVILFEENLHIPNGPACHVLTWAGFCSGTWTGSWEWGQMTLKKVAWALTGVQPAPDSYKNNFPTSTRCCLLDFENLFFFQSRALAGFCSCALPLSSQLTTASRLLRMQSRVAVSLPGSAWALDRHRADSWPHHLLAVWLQAKKWKLGLLIWQMEITAPCQGAVRVHWGGDVSSCPTCDERSVCWDLASRCIFSLAQINFYENSLQVSMFLHRQRQDNLEGSKSKEISIRKKNYMKIEKCPKKKIWAYGNSPQ